MGKIENDLSKIIVDTCYHIHVKLGPGLFESIYEEILCHELVKKGLNVQRQTALPVVWEELVLDKGFRTDVIVENKVIIEIKSVESLSPIHGKQLLSYLKLSGMKLGLLVNFNEELIKNGIKRIVNKI